MKLFIFFIFSLICVPSYALEPLSLAPEFSLPGVTKNEKISLSQFKGKTIVLEWLNHGCPFIQKHYETNNMQTLQKKFTSKGIIWLSIISSAPGKQGHVTREEALKEMKENKSNATNVLLDETGEVGKLYGAKTTPHMFVIDPQGRLAYQGAIDDQPDLERGEMQKAKNYVQLALDEIISNKAVSINSVKAYGCSVKY